MPEERMAMTPQYPRWAFEDFESGQVFESQGRTITDADLTFFAGWSWDTNPVHTDAVAQTGSRFGHIIAHGLLGMSVAMGLTSRLGVFEPCSVALLSVDDWIFAAPIRPGDTLRVRVEILNARLTSSGTTGVLQRQFTLTNQDGRTVQSGRIDLLVSTRETGRTGPPTVGRHELSQGNEQACQRIMHPAQSDSPGRQ